MSAGQHGGGASASDPFSQLFAAASEDGERICTESGWASFVAALVENGLVQEHELLFLDSIWVEKSRDQHYFGQTTAVEVWFADFEAALMKHYLGQAEQSKVETTIGEIARQAKSLALQTSTADWDLTELSDYHLRKYLMFQEQLNEEHEYLVTQAHEHAVKKTAMMNKQQQQNLISRGRDGVESSIFYTGQQYQDSHVAEIEHALQRVRIKQQSHIQVARDVRGRQLRDRFGHARYHSHNISTALGTSVNTASAIEIVRIPKKQRVPFIIVEEIWNNFSAHRSNKQCLCIHPAPVYCV
jgi:hypothetical protein